MFPGVSETPTAKLVRLWRTLLTVPPGRRNLPIFSGGRAASGTHAPPCIAPTGAWVPEHALSPGLTPGAIIFRPYGADPLSGSSRLSPPRRPGAGCRDAINLWSLASASGSVHERARLRPATLTRPANRVPSFTLGADGGSGPTGQPPSIPPWYGGSWWRHPLPRGYYRVPRATRLSMGTGGSA